MNITTLKDNDYILYIAQECNFQTRSLLIPAKKYLSVDKRLDDYKILKKCSIKNAAFTFGDDTYVIDNLLPFRLLPVDGNKNVLKEEITEYSEICGRLTYYADGTDYCDDRDVDWYEGSIGGFCSGFNHIKNYNQYKMATNVKGIDVNIIDSFLAIEMKEEGVIALSKWDTVDEMMDELYPM